MVKKPVRPGLDPDVRMLRSALASRANTVMGGVLKGPEAVSGGGDAITYFGGAGGVPVADTIYAGGDAILSRLGLRSDTVYGGDWRSDTVYGGDWRSDTIYGGARADTIYAGLPNPMRVVTATVVDPRTRQTLSVTYDRQTTSYLDKALNRWVLAPRWMQSQIG